MQIDQMTVEGKRCPLGIDVSTPAFGWSYITGTIRSQQQTAYRIVVSMSEQCAANGTGDLWDSGKTVSRNQVHVLFKGPRLQSRHRYYWKVQVWDQADRMTESAVSWWEMGLLHPEDWSASWIGEPDQERNERSALPIFRHEFALDKPVARARAYVCGLGHFELRLNGSKISDNVLEPGWTNYRRTCLYCVYDVTDQLLQGANAVGLMLGNGFYNVTGGRYRKFKGSFGKPKCLVQLEVTYADGTAITIASSPEWTAAAGPITFSCIYGGEDYDARLLQPGWDQPGFADKAGWNPAATAELPSGVLKAQATAPLKVMGMFRPMNVTEPVPGIYVADFGQNFSGWVELTVAGPRGALITLTPAELLKEDGTANQKWTGSPTQFRYILSGDGEEIWAPRFSYTGLRYVQIEGAVPADWVQDSASLSQAGVRLLRLEGQMIYPDMQTAGSFECSDPMLNKIHEIISWAILSNTKSIFTDCPHREKLGWLEQIHLMGPSVAYNYDVHALLTKTMEDIRDAQQPNGMVPTTAPEYVVFSEQWRCFRDSVSWGATYVLCGWNLYRMYGNTRILAEHYEGMRAYVDYVTACSDQYIVQNGLGDWYDVCDGDPGFAQNTPVPHTETAMYFHMTDVFAQIAELLGNHHDAGKYTELREQIKLAFNRTFFNPETGGYATGSQTSNAMPLVLGLVDDSRKGPVLHRLIDDIRRRGYHTTAGDVGHRYVLLALALNNRSDIIYEMTRQTGHPSYGYQLAHGATTLTEAWDGPTVGKSQNHFMLGHLEEWLYGGLAGIRYHYDAELESYQLAIQPFVPADLDAVEAALRLPAGNVRAEWRRDCGNQLTMKVSIPVNCDAEVYIPSSSAAAIHESGIPVNHCPDTELVRMEHGCAVVRLGSGHYVFTSVMQPTAPTYF
ncbi:alpha-L-rhamnosidase [Paenibacillus sp. H1-7]|uniref:alpha-L-rhamnosidase n=1 Tax=Paenibacillus sp. H1-7 TaxID=2282849 RepID=UPI001EF80817|nr:alpha-L-rhamnosidase [Paenibacillus sp. H1-7]ULL17152.1 alpha-L-rhamnosidase [Paenibacillus sp. H1-7]